MQLPNYLKGEDIEDAQVEEKTAPKKDKKE